MIVARRRASCKVLQSAPCRTSSSRTSRRFAHDEHGHSAHHSHPASENESFGKGFYVTLAVLPASYLTYTLSRPGADGKSHPVTQLLDKYSDWREEWEQRNAIHTRLVEQAGHDRNLFIHTPAPNHIELRFPEQFSTGSQVAVHAGSKANLEELIAHYRNKAFEEEDEKTGRLRRGEIPGQKEYRGP
ncbi:MAG: hypothetical protein M1831_002847 [Alyxoria varia]|nr:MAG: hypothetical protein M1831_002847 [Alyxoria varia]